MKRGAIDWKSKFEQSLLYLAGRQQKTLRNFVAFVGEEIAQFAVVDLLACFTQSQQWYVQTMAQNIRDHNISLTSCCRTEQFFQIFFLHIQRESRKLRIEIKVYRRDGGKWMDDFTLYILNLTFLFEPSPSSSSLSLSNGTSAPSPWHIAFAQFSASTLAARMQSTRPCGEMISC